MREDDGDKIEDRASWGYDLRYLSPAGARNCRQRADVGMRGGAWMKAWGSHAHVSLPDSAHVHCYALFQRLFAWDKCSGF